MEEQIVSPIVDYVSTLVVERWIEMVLFGGLVMILRLLSTRDIRRELKALKEKHQPKPSDPIHDAQVIIEPQDGTLEPFVNCTIMPPKEDAIHYTIRLGRGTQG